MENQFDKITGSKQVEKHFISAPCHLLVFNSEDIIVERVEKVEDSESYAILGFEYKGYAYAINSLACCALNGYFFNNAKLHPLPKMSFEQRLALMSAQPVTETIKVLSQYCNVAQDTARYPILVWKD